jgi:hypothetical protein
MRGHKKKVAELRWADGIFLLKSRRRRFGSLAFSPNGRRRKPAVQRVHGGLTARRSPLG